MIQTNLVQTHKFTQIQIYCCFNFFFFNSLFVNYTTTNPNKPISGLSYKKLKHAQQQQQEFKNNQRTATSTQISSYKQLSL